MIQKIHKTRRSIYVPKAFHAYAKKQGNISQFVIDAMLEYIKELEQTTFSKIPTEFVIHTIYWNSRYEEILEKWLPYSAHTSASGFLRHAIDRKIRKAETDAEHEFRKALENPLEADEIIVGNRTVKILRRLD